MSNPNKRKGSAYESAILQWLRGKGLLAEKLALAGTNDEGDIVCFIAGKPYVLELKNRAKLELPQFWKEATIEAANYAKARNLKEVPPAYVIVKRRNAGIEQSWVIQTLEQWIGEPNE